MSLLRWDCNLMFVTKDGTTTYYRDGQEVASPWVLLEDDEEPREVSDDR
jgi:hypothetical protein